MLIKIVSGGQTGVDQAALFVATEMNIETVGYCPKGGLDEQNESILKKYPHFIEATTEDPSERTKLNIENSDGTLIIVPKYPLPSKIKDGTQLTIDHAELKNKPFLVLDLSLQQEILIQKVQEWLAEHPINVLNIGGPRESNSLGIYDETCKLLTCLLEKLKINNSLSLRN